jgi:hypothetical protein
MRNPRGREQSRGSWLLLRCACVAEANMEWGDGQVRRHDGKETRDFRIIERRGHSHRVLKA